MWAGRSSSSWRQHREARLGSTWRPLASPARPGTFRGMRSESRRALVISAHPDDIEFGCAGTVCAWVDAGWDVRYAIVTSGQKGVQDAAQDPEEFGRRR